MLSAPSHPVDAWAALAFAHPLRRYQRDALSAFERVRDDPGTRA
jgi:hypothetical protein